MGTCQQHELLYYPLCVWPSHFSSLMSTTHSSQQIKQHTFIQSHVQLATRKEQSSNLEAVNPSIPNFFFWRNRSGIPYCLHSEPRPFFFILFANNKSVFSLTLIRFLEYTSIPNFILFFSSASPYPKSEGFLLSHSFYLYIRTYDSYSYELEQLASNVDEYRVWFQYVLGCILCISYVTRTYDARSYTTHI